MKKKLKLIAAIITAFMSSNAHAMDSSKILSETYIWSMPHTNENQDPQQFYADLSCFTMSFLKVEEVLKFAQTSKGHWNAYKNTFPGLILDASIHVDDYLKLFAKAFSSGCPFVSSGFIKQMFTVYPALKTSYSLRNSSVFDQIVEEDSCVIQGLEKMADFLQPYIDIYPQITQSNPTPYIKYPHQDTARLRAFSSMISMEKYPNMSVRNKIWSVKNLIDSGEKLKVSQAQVLLEIAQDNSITKRFRVNAAQYLIEFSQRYQGQAEDFLFNVMNEEYEVFQERYQHYGMSEADLSFLNRMNAAMPLIEFSQRYHAQAEDFLSNVINDIDAPVHHKVDAAIHLLWFSQRYQRQGECFLFNVATDPSQEISDKINAARSLMAFGERYLGHVEEVFHEGDIIENLNSAGYLIEFGKRCRGHVEEVEPRK